MTPVWWQIHGKYYSLDQIRAGDFPENLTSFEQGTLSFARDWLLGVDRFAITTSGSTGVPKTISIRRDQMIASAKSTAEALALQAGQTAMLCLDTRYIAGLMMVVRSLTNQLNLLVVEPLANPWQRIPEATIIHFAALVPYQLQAVLRSDTTRRRLDMVDKIILGGAPVDEQLKTQIRDLACRVYATYGMTETISHIALQLLNGKDANEYYKLLPGISIEKDNRECLVIHAPQLSDEPVVTNDLVDIESPTQFRWLGRWDHIINSGGIKVIPEKVEREAGEVFHLTGLINRFFVAGMNDPLLGSKVVLVVEGAPLTVEQNEIIRQQLGKRLNRFEIPKEIRSVDRFVETQTQKIDRKATLLLLKS